MKETQIIQRGLALLSVKAVKTATEARALARKQLAAEAKSAYQRIANMEELKQLVTKDGSIECFILLNFGVRSSKLVYLSAGRFMVDNFIDNTTTTLTQSNIPWAIKGCALWREKGKR